jgi:hypothetical protein
MNKGSGIYWYRIWLIVTVCLNGTLQGRNIGRFEPTGIGRNCTHWGRKIKPRIIRNRANKSCHCTMEIAINGFRNRPFLSDNQVDRITIQLWCADGRNISANTGYWSRTVAVITFRSSKDPLHGIHWKLRWPSLARILRIQGSMSGCSVSSPDSWCVGPVPY